MAVSAAVLTSGTAAAGGTSTITASISPEGTRALMLVMVYIRGSSTNPSNPTISGAATAWSSQSGSLFDQTGTARGAIYVSLARGTLSSGTVTITHAWTLAADDRLYYAVLELTEVENNYMTGGDFVYNQPAILCCNMASGSSSSPSPIQANGDPIVTANVTAAYNLLIVGWSHTANITHSAPAGWTELIEVSGSGGVNPGGLAISTLASSHTSATAVTSTIGASCPWGSLLLEVVPTRGGVQMMKEPTSGTYVSRASAGTLSPLYTRAAIPGFTVQTNDLGMIFIAGKAYGSFPVPTGLTGWTKHIDYHYAAGEIRVVSYYKFLTAGEAPPTITIGSDWMTGGTPTAEAVTAVFRNVDVTTPIESALTSLQGSATPITPNTRTSVTANGLQLVVCGILGGFIYPLGTGGTQRSWSINNNFGSNMSFLERPVKAAGVTPAAATGQNTAGATPYVVGTFGLKAATYTAATPVMDAVDITMTIDAVADGSLNILGEMRGLGTNTATLELESEVPLPASRYPSRRRVTIWTHGLDGDRNGSVV